MTRAAAADIAGSRLRQRDTYLADVFSKGTRVNLTVGRGAAENALSARAVFEVDGVNVNRELIDEGFGQVIYI